MILRNQLFHTRVHSNIKADSKPIHFFLSDKSLNCIVQLFNDNGNMKPWEDINVEFHLKYAQKMSKSWKDIILQVKENSKNLFILDHYIVRESQICSISIYFEYKDEHVPV